VPQHDTGDLGGRRAALLGSLQATPPSPTSLRPRRTSTSSGKSVPLPFFLFLHVPRPSARGCTLCYDMTRHVDQPKTTRHPTPRCPMSGGHTPHTTPHHCTPHYTLPHTAHRAMPPHTPCHAMPCPTTSSGHTSCTAPCRDVTHRVAACHVPQHEDDALRCGTTRDGDTGRSTGGTTVTARCSTTCNRSEAR